MPSDPIDVPLSLSLLDIPADVLLCIADALDAVSLARFAATNTSLNPLALQTLVQREAAVGRVYPSCPPRNLSSWVPYIARLQSRRPDSWKPVAAGRYSSFFVAEGGKLMSGGWEWHDAILGQFSVRRNVGAPPTQLPSMEGIRIVNINHGGAFCAAVSAAGAVYTWGLGTKGQLGHGDKESMYEPNVVRGLEAHRVLSVATGHAHCIAVTESGDVFSWGFDRFGQCGHGVAAKERLLPSHVEALIGVSARSASAGDLHTLVVADDGSLYSFGDGARGQLGRGCACVEFSPRLVESLQQVRIVSAAAGYYHSVALTAAGLVYFWGDMIPHSGFNESGILRSGVPMLVRGLGGIRVCAVAAGDGTSCVVTASGELFTWGVGPELGHGDTHARLVPKRVEALRGEVVVAVSISRRHTLAVTKEGCVFGWGDMEARCLPSGGAGGGDSLFSPCRYTEIVCRR